MYSQLAEAAQRAGRPEEAAELRSHKAAVFSGEEMYRCLIRKDQLLPDELKNHPAINSSVLIVVRRDCLRQTSAILSFVCL